MKHQRYDHLASDPLEIAYQVLDMIKTKGLSADPIHFLVLFEWFSKIDRQVAQQISESLVSNQYNDDVAEVFFEEILLKSHTELFINRQFESLLTTLSTQVGDWLGNFDQQSQIVNHVIRTLEKAALPPPQQALIQQKLKPAMIEQQLSSQVLLQHVTQISHQFTQMQAELTQVTQLAITDELTGLLNRRGLKQVFAKISEQALQQQSSFAFLVVDIDFFKKINDEYGHLVGDSALRFVAKNLVNETKHKDQVCRIGGEEFAILLPDTSYSNAMTFANCIRAHLADTKLKMTQHNRLLTLNISIGVAVYQLGETLETLFERADKALYKAKQTGRNKVVGEAQA